MIFYIKILKSDLCVLLSAGFKNVTADSVDCNDKREFIESQLFHTFTAQILKGYYLTPGYALTGECACTAYGTEVYRTVAFYGVCYGRLALSLSYHCG